MKLRGWDGIGFTIESDRTIPKEISDFVASYGCREILIQRTGIRFIKRRLKTQRLGGYGHLIITRQCSWSIAQPNKLKYIDDFETAIISLPIAYIISAIGETDADYFVFDYGACIKIPWRVLVRHPAVISIIAGLLRIALLISCNPLNREIFQGVFKFIDKKDVKDAFIERDVDTLRFIFTHILQRMKEVIDENYCDFLSSRIFKAKDKHEICYLTVYDFVFNTAQNGNLFDILPQSDWKHLYFRGIVAFMRENYDLVKRFIPEYKEDDGA